jgi:hypothetical protein
MKTAAENPASSSSLYFANFQPVMGGKCQTLGTEAIDLTNVVSDCATGHKVLTNFASETGEVDLPEDLTLDERRALQWPSHWGFFLQPPATVKTRDAPGAFIRHEINLDPEKPARVASDDYLDLLDGNQADWINSRLGNETTSARLGIACCTLIQRRIRQHLESYVVWDRATVKNATAAFDRANDLAGDMFSSLP